MDNNQNAARIAISTRLVHNYKPLQLQLQFGFVLFCEYVCLFVALPLIRYAWCRLFAEASAQAIFADRRHITILKLIFHLIQHLIGNYYILTTCSRRRLRLVWWDSFSSSLVAFNEHTYVSIDYMSAMKMKLNTILNQNNGKRINFNCRT